MELAIGMAIVDYVRGPKRGVRAVSFPLFGEKNE